MLAAPPAVLSPESASAAAARGDRAERIAVIDLDAPSPSPSPGRPRDDADNQLQAAITAAGFEPVTGDGVEDALAGRDVDRDTFELTAALATAQRAFGELRCNEAVPAANQAIGMAAARQAAGLPVPELSRAWIYVLLCADRDNQIDAALTAASRLHTLGTGVRPDEVPASVWAKYPVIDSAADLEQVALDIATEEPGAAIWIDFQRAGVSPLHIALPAGDHVIAAALGTRRGWAAGTAVRTQHQIQVPLVEAAGTWSDLARRVAGWHGTLPAPTELAWVLARVRARIVLVRSGQTIAAWGQVGRSELPHPLGADHSGSGPIREADRVLGVVADRIHAWNDHAPDPDQPLLLDSGSARRGARTDEGDKPTKWWVYAAIAGAAAVGGGILLVNEIGTDRQRVELHYP
ncbi:MAG TPA: hypothetical protein VH165_21160 [Kofleriaceae bacterium]|nr:hypothetical protein [Kofleriaceae bacterium]